jgi:uncharacterized protein (DUF2249 family)
MTNEKLKEYKLLSESNDDKINELRSRINEINKLNEDQANQYHKKLEILQNNLLENDEADINNLTILVRTVNDTVNDYSNLLKVKISNLMSTLLEFKEETFKADSKMMSMIRDRHDVVVEMLGKLKIKEEIKPLTKENPKSAEMIEWLKKQLNELQPFKNKVMALENKIISLENANKTLNAQIKNNIDKTFSNEKIIELKEEKINELKVYIENLEARLSDVKDFVFRNCPEQLDEFNNSFKNY